MYPEVFEPAETDQLAKYLNHRRSMLEEFQKSSMPVPQLPLLPRTTTSFGAEAAAVQERGQKFLEWGFQGVANRDRLVISKADLQTIKAKITSIRKATAQVASPEVSVSCFSLAATEKQECLLSRTSIKKAPRFAYHPRKESDSRAMEFMESGGLRPLKNSCRSFAEIARKFALKAVKIEDEIDDPSTLFKGVNLMGTW